MRNNDLPHAWENAEMPFGDASPYEHCSWCGGVIYEGEWFHLIDGEPVCEECIDNTKMEAGA